MKTNVINGHKEVDKIMVIMGMYEKYVPVFYNSKNYKYNIIQAIYSNPEYHDDWIGFIKFAKENKLDDMDIRGTLMHDIGGLIRKDEIEINNIKLVVKHNDVGYSIDTYITPNEFEREEMKILFNNDTGDMPIDEQSYYFEELLEGI